MCKCLLLCQHMKLSEMTSPKEGRSYPVRQSHARTALKIMLRQFYLFRRFHQIVPQLLPKFETAHPALRQKPGHQQAVHVTQIRCNPLGLQEDAWQDLISSKPQNMTLISIKPGWFMQASQSSAHHTASPSGSSALGANTS